MKKTAELDINEYIKLAEEKVGYVGDVHYLRPTEKTGIIAGQFEIVSFERAENPHFWCSENVRENDTPNGAELGCFYVKMLNTKYYAGKIVKYEVCAAVQDENGNKDYRLFIDPYDHKTWDRKLKYYRFPMIN